MLRLLGTRLLILILIFALGSRLLLVLAVGWCLLTVSLCSSRPLRTKLGRGVGFVLLLLLLIRIWLLCVFSPFVSVAVCSLCSSRPLREELVDVDLRGVGFLLLLLLLLLLPVLLLLLLQNSGVCSSSVSAIPTARRGGNRGYLAICGVVGSSGPLANLRGR
jgi:hypothetical protein